MSQKMSDKYFLIPVKDNSRAPGEQCRDIPVPGG